MKRKQTFMRPGFYHGRLVTKKDVENHVRGTNEMIAAGYAPVLFLEHPPKGSDEGAPKSLRDVKIEQLRNAAGWAERVEMNADGSADVVFDVTDPEVDKKIADGSIRFTSPETRPTHQIGAMRFSNVLAHFALTHEPIFTNQSRIEPASEAFTEVMQFSLADWKPDMADDKDEKDEPEKSESQPEAAPPETDNAPPTEPEKPANPDMPEGGEISGEALQSQRIEAILAHLANMGVVLPADTPTVDIPTLLDRLLTGCMTLEAAMKKAEQEKAPPEAEDDGGKDGTPPNVVEQQGMMQYSVADIGTIENKMLARVIKHEHEKLVGKLNSMVSKFKITEGARDALLAIDGAVQYSANGDLVPTLTIGQMVDLLDEHLLEGQCMGAEQFSALEHPDGDAHYATSGDVTSDQAAKLVEEQSKVLGGMFRSK